MPKSQQRTGRRLLTIGATTAVAAGAVLVNTALPAYAAIATLSQTQVAASGGTVLRVLGTGLDISDAYGVRFVPSAASCPGTYGAASSPTGAVSAGTMDAFGTSTAVIVTPAGLTAGSTYKVCVYAGILSGDTSISADTIPDVTAVNMAAQNTTVVKATDKVTLTAPTAIFSGTGYASQFVNTTTTTCPLTLQTPAAPGPPAYITSPNTTKVVGSNSRIEVTVPTIVAGTPYLVCTYATGTNGAALVARSRSTVSTAPALADAPVAVISPSGGSSATATTVTQSLPSGSTLFAITPDVLITQNACATTRPAALGGDYLQGGVTKIANNKVAVTIPTSVVVSTGDVTTPWNLCTYADTSTGSALVLQPAVYNVAPILNLGGATFSQSGGPAQGSQVVSITGLTGIPTAEGALLSANLGGSPITITGKTATSITGTTSSHAAGPAKLSVTTAAGTKTTVGTPYTYSYGITVTPNTAPTGTTPVIDVMGAGFSSLTFGDVTTGAPLVDDTAYVFLTSNTWNAQTFTPTTGISAFAVAPVSYCNNVLPISDNEIICTLNLDARIDSVSTFTPTITTVEVPSGTYTVSVVNDRDTLASNLYNYSIVSSGSTFTVSSF